MNALNRTYLINMKIVLLNLLLNQD